MASIIQLKKFLTGVQIFPKTKTKAVYDDNGNRLDNVLSNLESSATSLKKGSVVVSENADYAEIGVWVDGNPSSENRIGKFVEIDPNTEGQTIRIANAHSDITGVVVEHPAFSANASAEKFDSDGNLLPQYAYVCLLGLAVVKDNGTCTVNQRCMPNDSGDATLSSNNMGYQVISRVDATHILIAVSPNGDMIQRIKTDIGNKSNEPIVIATTMNASDWVDGHYDFTDYPSPQYRLELDINGDVATQQQIDAWSDAVLCGSNNSRVIARGVVPTIDLPILLTVARASNYKVENQVTEVEILEHFADENVHITPLERWTWNRKAEKPTITTMTMNVDSWSSNQYSFEGTYPVSDYDISIELDGDIATEEQVEAWSSAKICGSSTGNKCIAKGDVPTIDIPIIIKVVAK